MKTQQIRSRLQTASALSDTCDVNVVHLDAVRAARATLPAPAALGRMADVLGLLANPTRLRVLLALRPSRSVGSCELCVCDLAVIAGASKSMTSHQLRLLRTAGLVVPRRDGKLTYYRLAEGPVRSLLDEAVGFVAALDD